MMKTEEALKHLKNIILEFIEEFNAVSFTIPHKNIYQYVYERIFQENCHEFLKSGSLITRVKYIPLNEDQKKAYLVLRNNCEALCQYIDTIK